MPKYLLLTYVSVVLFFLTFSHATQINDDVTIIKNSSLKLIDENAKIEVLGKSFIATEGPLWDSKNNQLIFSDVRQNKIFTWSERNGINEYITPSGSTGYAPFASEIIKGSNGLAFDKNQNIILCQVNDRRISYVINMKSNKPIFNTIADKFKGKRFNSPNDLSISKSGNIYFTDPPYGFFVNGKNVEKKYREIKFNGVYKLSSNGKISLITSSMSLPNGIAVSNDEKYLYVNNAGKEDPKIMRFNLSSLKGKLFFDGKELSKKYKGSFDGLKIHSSGNIFTTGPNGILIISPKGVLIASINYGKPITNCNFDSNEEYLYVTGFDDISRIKLK
tara:strand:- start:289 stop:1287 length:999 start_codon:yes stop_codon:yes gene_type:complete